MLLGDGKRSDVLCCRMTHYKQPRTSRACYTTFDVLVQPRDPQSRRRIVDCKWVLQQEQQLLLHGCQEPGKEDDDKLIRDLKLVSTICCDLPMFDLCYGGSPYGQYYACTVDMMHAFEHGVLVYILKAFVDPISGPRKKELDKIVHLIFTIVAPRKIRTHAPISRKE